MSVTSPIGFVASGIAAGIKTSGDKDLALVATSDSKPVPTAAVFTKNKMTAAPVLVSKKHILQTNGNISGVILNSGNANAANGEKGFNDATAMAKETAGHLGCETNEILVCSTGLIGMPFPVETILQGIDPLVATRSNTGGHDAATAICTTDTVKKEVEIHGNGFTIGGMAKGAAMLAPNMATMLAVLTTDAQVGQVTLQQILTRAVDVSFNALITDGCTSTNDTVILLANGQTGSPDIAEFEDLVTQACQSLARQMAQDAEGATKVVTLRIHGAKNDQEAEQGARKVAMSALCKCSWYGADPYWGRIASELGSAGITFEQQKVAVSYGGICVASEGIAISHDEKQVSEHMAQRELTIDVDLGVGTGEAVVLTNDLTHAYIDENMGTS